MSGPDIEARARAIQEQALLVQQLRDGGNDSEADRLHETYHAREMSGLAADVYLSAKLDGEPPTGWIRGSGDPAALRSAGFDMTDREVRERLQPRQSGFRAEIYIPDKTVFGEDAKPVVVYKGSTGEIADPFAPGGRRESGGEDFLNSGRQGIGMRSDYYDRAMRLAMIMSRHVPGGFEIAGHSLGGGMASAASAVTGARATTFNAAGLHPDTPSRFAKENGLPTFNPQQSVHTYQTSGEVLNDVQNGIRRLNAQQRHAYGLLANEASLLLRDPMMQVRVAEKMRGMLPPGAQAAAGEFVQQLATMPGHEALRNMPVAAGRMEIMLDAMARDGQGALVDRALMEAPSQVAELAGPLSKVLHAAAHGMHDGRAVGGQIERGGAALARGLEKTGDGAAQIARVQGRVLGGVVEIGSTSLQLGAEASTAVYAEGRALRGWIESVSHRVESRVQSGALSIASWGAATLGMDDTAKDLSRGANAIQAAGEARATAASLHAREDADAVRGMGRRTADSIDDGGQWVAGGLDNGYATAGATIDKGVDLAAHHVATTTAQAPSVLASAGGIIAGLQSTSRHYVPTPITLENSGHIIDTKRLYERIGPAVGEAVQRHGMQGTVIPSLDAELLKQEAAAREWVQQHDPIVHPGAAPQTSSGPETAMPVIGINDPEHQDYALFAGAQTGVYGLDARYKRSPDLQSDQLAGALAAQAKQDGLQSIRHVLLSDDRVRAFAVDSEDATSLTRRYAYVDVATGMKQPLAVSTEQAEAVDRLRQTATSAPHLAAGVAAEQQERGAIRVS